MAESMLIKPEIEKSLVKLLEIELTASHIYRYMAMWCDKAGYFGAQTFYAKQANEEMEHAAKVADYIIDREGCAVMPGIPTIEAEFSNIKQVLERTLLEEKKVETKWRAFAEQCRKANDEPSYSFAQWYIDEQVHEVAKIADFLSIITMIGEGGLAYIEVDKAMRV